MPDSKNVPATKYKLIGKNYTTPDLYAKVTGRSKYAEDYRADGMLFCKLLLSPMPHARVRSIDARAALAMPGVKAILTADELPPPADSINDNGTVRKHGADCVLRLNLFDTGIDASDRSHARGNFHVLIGGKRPACCLCRLDNAVGFSQSMFALFLKFE